MNGEILAQGSQFSMKDVEVISAVADLNEVRAYRFAPSRSLQALQAPAYRRIETDFTLSAEGDDYNLDLAPSPVIEPQYLSPQEEIAQSTGHWLFDYLRRSGASGFLVPLSGLVFSPQWLKYFDENPQRHRQLCHGRHGPRHVSLRNSSIERRQ
jgi:NAD+ synthase (glutamine-hydrolysing)